METIKWLEGIVAFVRVAESGSFSNAAGSLGVSKSHISKTIKLLEDDLGVALFSRSTRQVELTSVGSQFLDRCRQSLETMDLARKDIIQSADKPRGLLRVTMAGVFGEKYIAPVLIHMALKFPDLKVELVFDSRIIDLISERFDVAIRIGHLPDSSLYAVKIATRHEFICCSPAYRESAPRILQPEDLSEHNCLGDSSSWFFQDNGKVIRIPIQGNLKTNNPRVLHRAALESLGIIKLPGSYVWDDIKEGRLVSLLEDFAEGKKDIWAVTPNRHEQNINVRTFIQEVKLSLSEGYPALLF